MRFPRVTIGVAGISRISQSALMDTLRIGKAPKARISVARMLHYTSHSPLDAKSCESSLTVSVLLGLHSPSG